MRLRDYILLRDCDFNIQDIEIPNMNDEEKSLSHYNIGDILITKSGDVLVGTSDGLNIYNPELSI